MINFIKNLFKTEPKPHIIHFFLIEDQNTKEVVSWFTTEDRVLDDKIDSDYIDNELAFILTNIHPTFINNSKVYLYEFNKSILASRLISSRLIKRRNESEGLILKRFNSDILELHKESITVTDEYIKQVKNRGGFFAVDLE